jgi:hypothetical protein
VALGAVRRAGGGAGWEPLATEGAAILRNLGSAEDPDRLGWWLIPSAVEGRSGEEPIDTVASA